ncbi:dTDP-4-dehydrorhamnose reductase [Microbulbifer hydrolyticus]|uniref:dTDP-4-dehydrorhamnose reductase n=1 Tax=Microbulbifer hydrolyticus TaxID=48074 RepID=A0A6P1TE76_9GAMM|nr:dTDP-4-dehydrorhamnose reductase [Microbulbifer hydrolyticus]MBB5212318.1 dTDP-4-dehydrorhamnose reductase [Microbulbifer hydrolyticus]QHQ39965.1 dTDP-4-dehydrorhamnose reductase [Microbulbifer hydrolyticus]
MKILITGKNGQLGKQLQKQVPAGVTLVAHGRDTVDVANKEQVFSVLGGAKPDVVINAAAYTAVDKAESDIEQAHAINARGSENLALACRELGARLIHVSTDFVFDGQQSHPYKPEDYRKPLGVYGESKARGEEAIEAILPEAIIVRTAWVYDREGGNFVTTMLRLMNERDQLGVVADQIGTPTWAGTLAQSIYALAENSEAKGIYHCTDAGAASWYDFAVAIFEEGKSAGLLPQDKQVKVGPIATADYPTPAARPAYSVLDKSRLVKEAGVELKHWRQVLRAALNTTELQK